MTIDELNDLQKEIWELEQSLKEKKEIKVKAFKDLHAYWCCKCSRYFEFEKLKCFTREETQTETTIPDRGYGDDDEVAEVTRRYTELKCPCCGAVLEEYDTIVKTENRRRRK